MTWVIRIVVSKHGIYTLTIITLPLRNVLKDFLRGAEHHLQDFRRPQDEVTT